MVSLTMNHNINEIRISLAKSEKGLYVEVNLEAGNAPWMSQSTLKLIGYNETQLKAMSLYDMIPNEFHDSLSNTIIDGVNGREHKHNIWPFKCVDGDILWFYSSKENVNRSKDIDKSISWYKLSLINKTLKNGKDYADMVLKMYLLNTQNELKNKIKDQEIRMDREFSSIQDKNKALNDGLIEMKQKFIYATSAMEKAATAAMRSSADVTTLRSEFREGMARQTTEIIRLINMDSQHDELINNFNNKVMHAAEKAVEKAVEEISQKSKDVSTEIIIRAGNAGKNIAKKVTVPVSVIAVIMTVVQFILANWTKIFH